MCQTYATQYAGICTFASVSLNSNKVKNIRYFTNGVDVIEWDQELCMHSGKCLKNIPYINEKPGVYSISVSEREYQIILSQADYCPARALKIKEQK